MANKRKLQTSKFINSITIGILIGFIISFGIIFTIENLKTSSIIMRSEIPKSIQDIIDKCSNQSLFESSECVRNEVLIFFKYNNSNTGKDLTFEELIELGGVCSSWADLYCSIGEELEFNTKRISVIMGHYNDEYLGHAFCIWSDVIDEEHGGYVILDQTSIIKEQLKMN